MAPRMFLTCSTIPELEEYCAVCIGIYQGAVAHDEEQQKEAKRIAEEHVDKDWIVFSLPNPWVWLNGRYRIDHAVTWVNGTPVCLTHCQALGQQPASAMADGFSHLIPGKKHQVPPRREQN